jgi:diguanylate cyclase (GGDEF)-like protein
VSGSPPDLTGDDAPGLRAQLQAATDAAEQAYRDSSRLIRLLAVIAEPVSPDLLIDHALGALSEVFAADVTCLIYSAGRHTKIIAARGFGEHDDVRLPVLPGAEDLFVQCRLAAWVADDHGEEQNQDDEKPRAAGITIRSAAQIPLSDQDFFGEALVLLRADKEPFSTGELQMLQSVAARLRALVEQGERRASIERLARTGHRFTRHLELAPLLDEALYVLRDMSGAECAAAVTVDGDLAELRAEQGMPEGVPGSWPRRPAELLAWPAALRGEPFIHPDLFDVPVPDDAPAPMVPGGTGPVGWVRSLVCVPVLHDGVPVALLYAGHSRAGFFSQSTVDAAAVLAGYVSAALVNARLYSALADSESRLRLMTDELRRRATHDSLTGLANRDLARQLLEHNLNSEQEEYVGLLFCDLDKFKAINDRLGHEAGDDLLCQVAERLRKCVRTDDLLARLGGDEFLIVLPSVDDLEAVTQVGNRVLEALSEPFLLGGARVRVAASVGGVVGERGADASQAVDLLRDADAAMYEAKNRGRGRVEVFDRFTAQKAVDRLTLREDLMTALDRGELEMYYQPIVQFADSRVSGFEALARWNHPELGRVPPVDFIPMAEETGAITQIGAWALAQACEHLARWKTVAGSPLSVAVNVSPVQLLDPTFAELAVQIIRDSGLRTEDVWLEVTESIEVTDQLIEQLRQLRDVGVRVAMDDFGMSYSNLGYLKHLPVERLKIDREFVAGLGVDADEDDGMDRGIVRAILAIAESAQMSVVAEGIETEEQRRVLTELGCRQGQGYLFAEPMSEQAATELVTPPPRPALNGSSPETLVS